MHIEGHIVVSIKHVARRGKNVAKMVDIPHGNGHTSHNIHARDMVCISIDSH